MHVLKRNTDLGIAGCVAASWTIISQASQLASQYIHMQVHCNQWRVNLLGWLASKLDTIVVVLVNTKFSQVRNVLRLLRTVRVASQLASWLAGWLAVAGCMTMGPLHQCVLRGSLSPTVPLLAHIVFSHCVPSRRHAYTWVCVYMYMCISTRHNCCEVMHVHTAQLQSFVACNILVDNNRQALALLLILLIMHALAALCDRGCLQFSVKLQVWINFMSALGISLFDRGISCMIFLVKVVQ